MATYHVPLTYHPRTTHVPPTINILHMFPLSCLVASACLQPPLCQGVCTNLTHERIDDVISEYVCTLLGGAHFLLGPLNRTYISITVRVVAIINVISHYRRGNDLSGIVVYNCRVCNLYAAMECLHFGNDPPQDPHPSPPVSAWVFPSDLRLTVFFVALMYKEAVGIVDTLCKYACSIFCKFFCIVINTLGKLDQN